MCYYLCLPVSEYKKELATCYTEERWLTRIVN